MRMLCEHREENILIRLEKLGTSSMAAPLHKISYTKLFFELRGTALAEQITGLASPGIRSNFTCKIFILVLMQKQGFHAFETIRAYEIFRRAQAAHLSAGKDA